MSDIKLERDGHVATVTLNRPERMNTISQDMLSAMSEALLTCDNDPSIRAIILTGEGRAFSAGLDLNDAASNEGISRGGFELGVKLDLRAFPPSVLYHLDKPTICALNGAAAGFGLDLALACDIRVAARRAKLSAAFAKRGILPDGGGTWHLPRLLGWAKAAEIVLTGKTLNAEECLELGLVNMVVDDDALMASAMALAREAAACAPLAAQSAKRMMRAGLQEGFDEHVERVYLQVLRIIQSRDFKEGYTAFLEKREPEFIGE
ncbi:MAG: enoyl-CoA hydratase/isomerase family protein [Deltaproteobacteria bacterium]|nr:enoyl-CoA hydratase/isomerase family protein [Deltaproteobacteria bacterium]